MLPNLAAALVLPFRQSLGGFANQQAITAEWNRVTALAPNHLPRFYVNPEGNEALQLSQPDIDAMLLKKVKQFEGWVVSSFPEFDSWPDAAKCGVMDMGYNLGVGRLKSLFPHFCKAVLAKNWALAASECKRQDIPDARNQWTYNKFMEASSQ
jgi:hypothetical protein